MVTNKIKIIDSALDYYPIEPKELILGRQYDNESDIIEIERPEAEKDSICTMIITDQNGTLIDHIIMANDIYYIKNNVSENKIVKVGFSFARQDGYVKNSAILIGRFLEAQKPDDFVPIQPEQQINIDYLINYGFTDSKYENGEIQFFNMKGNKVVSINIGKLIQEQSDWLEEDPTNASYIKNKPVIPSKTSDIINDSGFINKEVSNLTNYTLSTGVGSNLLVNIEPTTFIMRFQLQNAKGEMLGTEQMVDLPLETMVVNASYDSLTKEIVLTLKNGTTTRVSVADLVSGLQSEITESNKLNSDLVDDTNSINKFTNDDEKLNWNSKQDGTLSGETEPTINTVGKVGQFYLDTVSKKLYQCVGVTTNDSTTTYEWQVVGSETLAEAIRDNTIQISGNGENYTFKAGSARATGNYGVAIGWDAQAIGGSSIALGRETLVGSDNGGGIAIGYKAIARPQNAIQLGRGSNTTPNSFQIYDDNIYKANKHTLTVQNAEINGTKTYGVLQGTADPTNTTVGAVSQFYLNTTDKKLWQCVAVTTDESTSTTTYEWQPVGAGVSQEDFDKLVNNETQIVPTSGGLAIGGATSNGNNSIAIGNGSSTSNSTSSIAIGKGAIAPNNSCVSIGGDSRCQYSSSAAIGNNAISFASKAIQLGSGRNDISNSFQIYDDNIYKTDTHTLTVRNIAQNGNSVYGILSGTSAPTSDTVGSIGQFYIETTTPTLYYCSAITTGDTTTYTWTPAGGKQLYLHNIQIYNDAQNWVNFNVINDYESKYTTLLQVQTALNYSESRPYVIANGLLNGDICICNINAPPPDILPNYLGIGGYRIKLPSEIEIDDNIHYISENQYLSPIIENSYNFRYANNLIDTVVAL